jgi:glycerol uptake operon antiterminator
MENLQIKKLFSNNPVIPSVKNSFDLDIALKTDNEIIFILTSTITNIASLIEKVKDAGKTVFVHFDLVEGLARSAFAIDYIAEKTKTDGIITTKSNFVKTAKERNLIAIQRFFIVDSLSINTAIKVIKEHQPDAIEIMPGLMPKIIKFFANSTNMPVIAGGLISAKEDIMSALNSGACSISATEHKIWNI